MSTPISHLEVPVRGLQLHTPDGSMFPQVTPDTLGFICPRFKKLGQAVVILSANGEMLALKHSPNDSNGVTDGQWSVPAETVMGRFNGNELAEIETVEQVLVRGIHEESRIDLVVATRSVGDLMSSPHLFGLVDWDMGPNKPNLGHTLGTCVVLFANPDLEAYINDSYEPTDETLEARFIPLADVGKYNLRSGMAECMIKAQQLLTTNYIPSLQPVQLQHIPQCHTNGSWRDLRF